MNTLDSEKTIIGSILYHEGLIRNIQQHLSSPDDFLHSENRAIYEVMVDLDEQGMAVNLLTVFSALERKKNNPVDRGYLEDTVEGYAVEVVDAISIAKQLSEFSAQRLLEIKMEAIVKTIHNRESTVTEYIGMIEKAVSEVSRKTNTTTVAHGKILTNAFFDFLTTKRSEGLFTGIEAIDKNIFNFFAGEFIVVAARPGVGKTTLMIQSAIENLYKGKKVGFITMEMTPEQLLLRMIAYRSGVDSILITKLDALKLQTDINYMRKWAKVVEAISFFENSGLFIETASPYNLGTVVSTSRKLKYVHEIDYLYIDYIQLIEADRPGANRTAELTVITRKLKSLAGELAMPITAASQLSRAVEQRVGQRPTLADLRESGSIEQDASIVFFLYPDVSKYADLQSEALTAKLKVMPVIDVIGELGKQRSGPLGVWGLTFDKRVSRLTMREEERSFPIPEPEAPREETPEIDSDPWS